MDRTVIASELLKVAKRLTGARLGDVDVGDLIEFAKAYGKMGWAVQEQFLKLIDGNTEGLNPNAVDVIDHNLGRLHDDIKSAIAKFKKSQEDGEDEE